MIWQPSMSLMNVDAKGLNKMLTKKSNSTIITAYFLLRYLSLVHKENSNCEIHNSNRIGTVYTVLSLCSRKK